MPASDYDDGDLYSLFAEPDEPTEADRARAMAVALRGKRQLGTLDVLSGHPALGRLGDEELGEAAKGEAQLAALGQRRASLKSARDIAAANNAAALERAQLRLQRPVDPLDSDLKRARIGVLDATKAKLLRKGGAAAGGAPADDIMALKPNQLEEMFDKFGQAISTVRGRSNLNRERQRRLDAAEQLDALIRLPNGSIADLQPSQVREAATNLAKLIGSGQVSESQVEELDPDTYARQLAKFKAKVFNEVEPAHAQEFLANMLETAGRESSLAKKQIREGQLSALPTYAPLRRRDKVRFEAALKAVGIDPATIDESGLLTQSSAGAKSGPERVPASAGALGEAPVAGRAAPPLSTPPTGADAATRARMLDWALDTANANDPRLPSVLRKLGLSK